MKNDTHDSSVKDIIVAQEKPPEITISWRKILMIHLWKTSLLHRRNIQKLPFHQKVTISSVKDIIITQEKRPEINISWRKILMIHLWNRRNIQKLTFHQERYSTKNLQTDKPILNSADAALWIRSPLNPGRHSKNQ